MAKFENGSSRNSQYIESILTKEDVRIIGKLSVDHQQRNRSPRLCSCFQFLKPVILKCTIKQCLRIACQHGIKSGYNATSPLLFSNMLPKPQHLFNQAMKKKKPMKKIHGNDEFHIVKHMSME